MQIDTDNLGQLELADLLDAKKKIDRALATHQARRERELVDRVAAMAKEQGIDVAALAGQLSKKAGAGPKFRHRDKHELTWTGRGKKPGWMEQFGEKS